jgi:hypothetical protein
MVTAPAGTVYQPRRPRDSKLYRLVERFFPQFEHIYADRYEKRYGFWRPVIGRVVRKFLRCGDLHFGFARVRCPNAHCRHEMFVPFSCRQRCLCPSCHQKRALLLAQRIAQEICLPVPHRQFVFTVPKRLRLCFRFDRALLGQLARLAWQTVGELCRDHLGRSDALPGMVAGIQTFGDLIHFHPHIHAIVTDGAFTPDGVFRQLPPIDRAALLRVWMRNVFDLLLAAGKIDQAVVDQIHAWPHSGFSVDASVYLPGGDVDALERLAQYIVRCPFSLARVVRVTEAGSVVYRAEKSDCRRFPPAASGDLCGGPRRNFQVFDAFDFLAELTQHIPNKGEHLVRYYGCYSHRRLGMPGRGLCQFSGHDAFVVKASNLPDFVVQASRLPENTGETPAPQETSPSTCSNVHPPLKADRSLRPCSSPRGRAWAALIYRIYQVDPLLCPRCSGTMRVISFIEARQQDVIEKILRHCGLWEGPLRTLAKARPPPARGQPPAERHLVLDPEYLDELCQASELCEESARERGTTEPAELQLVLDPEFL